MTEFRKNPGYKNVNASSTVPPGTIKPYNPLRVDNNIKDRENITNIGKNLYDKCT